uniref:Glycoside hydrolase family 31 TIM barrel domain-containing protein n=1 Tax=Chromera velia CCMP2878 TaxID=1169474 RepID=A0A0G4GBX8_9ALVE|eukprot:Cvel_4487.t1-p1 / transcript=Cvel_4487.t1 / gene=Cvel_4487 / organism=Chromera_velia_CCMP2878 / gene_product=Alpha-glucosidase YihQ, putative / transcript_product=Alpha-glucosidase YihQ, putative / location=Cvel_scaffold196:66110-74460(+) / protein_length=1326 / sequence_SO=supercontig / SO=protein_coding / is_pseudo=false
MKRLYPPLLCTFLLALAFVRGSRVVYDVESEKKGRLGVFSWVANSKGLTFSAAPSRGNSTEQRGGDADGKVPEPFPVFHSDLSEPFLIMSAGHWELLEVSGNFKPNPALDIACTLFERQTIDWVSDSVGTAGVTVGGRLCRSTGADEEVEVEILESDAEREREREAVHGEREVGKGKAKTARRKRRAPSCGLLKDLPTCVPYSVVFSLLTDDAIKGTEREQSWAQQLRVDASVSLSPPSPSSVSVPEAGDDLSVGETIPPQWGNATRLTLQWAAYPEETATRKRQRMERTSTARMEREGEKETELETEKQGQSSSNREKTGRPRGTEKDVVVGCGTQYSHFDLRGLRVPILSSEQGVGRGLQPLSFLLNHNDPARPSGNPHSTSSAVPFFATSRGRGFFLETHDFAVFDFSEDDLVKIEVTVTHEASSVSDDAGDVSEGTRRSFSFSPSSGVAGSAPEVRTTGVLLAAHSKQHPDLVPSKPFFPDASLHEHPEGDGRRCTGPGETSGRDAGVCLAPREGGRGGRETEFLSSLPPLLSVVSQFTAYAGRMEELPRWASQGLAVGFWGGTEEAVRLIDKLKSAGVPLIGLWLQDWSGKRETPFGTRLWWNWDSDASHYPLWEEFLQTAARTGVRVLTYVNSFVSETVPSRERGGSRRHYFKDAEALGHLVLEKVSPPAIDEEGGAQENCGEDGSSCSSSSGDFHKGKEAAETGEGEDEGNGVQPLIQFSVNEDFRFGTVDLTKPEARDFFRDAIRCHVMLLPEFCPHGVTPVARGPPSSGDSAPTEVAGGAATLRLRVLLRSLESKWGIDLASPSNRKRAVELQLPVLEGRPGVGGWMADFSEYLPFNALLASGERASSVHNRWPELFAELNEAALEGTPYEGEAVVFYRAGSTRSPRSARLFWMGDQIPTFDRHDGMHSALLGQLTSGLSGWTLSHSDIGGYTMFWAPLRHPLSLVLVLSLLLLLGVVLPLLLCSAASGKTSLDCVGGKGGKQQGRTGEAAEGGGGEGKRKRGAKAVKSLEQQTEKTKALSRSRNDRPSGCKRVILRTSAIVLTVLAGFAFWGVCSVYKVRDRHLLMRWMEMSAVADAFLRSHQGNRPLASAQLWSDPVTLQFAARMAKLHVALAPQKRRLMKEARRFGLPLVRHALFEWMDAESRESFRSLTGRELPTAAECDFEFMLGRDVLMRPVLRRNAGTVDVFLPPLQPAGVGGGPAGGVKKSSSVPLRRMPSLMCVEDEDESDEDGWVHLWSGRVVGRVGGWVRVPAPLGEPALFVRRRFPGFEELLTRLREGGVLWESSGHNWWQRQCEEGSDDEGDGEGGQEEIEAEL